MEVRDSRDCYYVYALKDPRRSPALPFYIGKGIAVRAYDHLARPDNSRKGQRIKEIAASGHSALVSVLATDLTEAQALRLEAELISAFGTEDTGGLLTNAVVPSGTAIKQRKGIVVPSGVKEKAQLGLLLLKEAVLELAKANRGVTNSDVASLLGLHSDYCGGSKNYLSYSILGLLMREGKIARKAGTNRHLAQVQ